MKKKLVWGALIALCAVLVIVTMVGYYSFTVGHIFNESANHLKEIYNQVNANFTATVERNWNILNGWTSYIQEKAEEAEDNPQAGEELREFMDARKEDWGFTNFYFINSNGEGKLLDGRIWSLVYDEGNDEQTTNHRAEQLAKLQNGESVVIDGQRESDKVPITLFAVPTAEVRSYLGFEYNAMGVSFDTKDMTATLKIEAFSGAGRCAVINSQGKVIITSERHDGSEVIDENYIHFTNFIDYAKENGVFPNSSLEQVIEDIQNGTDSVTIFKEPNREWYFIYQPVVEQTSNRWMLIGLVPVNILNDSLNDFRAVTVCVMAAVFILLASAVVALVWVINRRHIQAQEVRLNSRDRLFDMLTTNTDDIYVLFSTDTFRCEYISSNMGRILGLESDRVRSDVRNIMDASVGDAPVFTTEALKRLPQKKTRESELRMRNAKTGEEYWFKLMLYRSIFNSGDNLVMMLSNRTQERKLNAELAQALDIAKAANAAKSNFLSNMSHDIRTPMNAIMGFSALLARNAENPEIVREYVKKINFSGRHLLELINEVLDMSKIESGTTFLNVEEFSMTEFFEELYAMVIPQAKAKKQTFEMYTKGNLPERLFGDRLRLNQILLNLLSNAVKYTQENGKIDLIIEEIEQSVHNHVHLRFVVRDNGLGMSEAFMQNLFKPFAREETKEKLEIQGTGLGMAITKNLVELMGGTITVQSKVGAGSTFCVELEFASEEKRGDGAFWQRHNITRMLVVDDEEDACLNVKNAMKDTGVEVSYVLCGEKAVQTVREAAAAGKPYSIVLLDREMPDMDGLETAKRIKALAGENSPILVLTVYNFDGIETEAKQAGIDLFLSKPFFMFGFRRSIERMQGVETAADKNKTSIAGMNILVAEDNEINAEILVDLLAGEGVQCDVTRNGKEVVDKFNESAAGTYDLILMDVQMPVMNGYEATMAIRAGSHAEAKTIPIFAMTANAFDDDVQKALRSGMNAHMAKPIDIEKMKSMIAGVKDKK